MSGTLNGYKYRNSEGEEMLLDIEYSYSPAYRGVREYGIPLEPDEGESIEFESITDEDGNDVEIPDKDLWEIEEKILDKLKDDYEDAKAEAKLDDMERDL